MGTVARWAAAVVVCCGVGLSLPAPAGAEPDADLIISGTQVTPGEVRFFLSTRGLPLGVVADQVALSAGLRVEAGGAALPSKVETVTSDARLAPSRAVALVIDTSGSMAGPAIEAARAAALQYAESLSSDVALGLVAFSDRPATLLAPSTDRSAFRAAVAGLVASGATALYDGVIAGAALLGDEYAERRVVVLSDGADTVSTRSGEAAATVLQTGDLTLDLVAFGPAAAGPLVAALATGSGGQLLAAADAAALKSAFQTLAAGLSAPVLVTVTVPGEMAGRSVEMNLAVDLGGASTTASFPVRFAVDTGSAGSGLATVPTPTRPASLLLVACIGLGGAVLIAASYGMYMLLGRITVRRRLRELSAFSADRLPSALAEAHESGFLRAALALSERAVQRPGLKSRIEIGLERAAIDLLPAEWMLLRAAVSVTVAAVLALLLPWWLGILIGLPAGWLLTLLYRKVKASRRAAKFADLLPDALHLMVGALRSGFSLAQAIDAMVREGPDPVAGEFARAVAETRLGGDLETALEGIADRNSNRDLLWLVMAVRIQREVGGNLSEVLQTAVETMRERGRLRRHVRGLSAEGRLSAYILVGMPLILAAWLFMFRMDYVRPLVTEPIGLVMLGTAALMLVVGAFWMSRVVTVDV
ncbi:MAG TPA: type II secretion system F family protein [Micromonosporaceae bacterium]|nr:type II secretion system F family protein [Micromonosporaceae bacterium]